MQLSQLIEQSNLCKTFRIHKIMKIFIYGDYCKMYIMVYIDVGAFDHQKTLLLLFYDRGWMALILNHSSNYLNC